MKAIVIGIWVALVVFIVGGWGQNLYKLCESDFESPYKTEIVCFTVYEIVKMIGGY